MQDKNGSDSAYRVPGTIPTSQILTRHYCMDAGYRTQSRCARFPVAGLGLRCSALIWWRVPVFEKRAHGVCKMQDRAEVMGDSHPCAS